MALPYLPVRHQGRPGATPFRPAGPAAALLLLLLTLAARPVAAQQAAPSEGEPAASASGAASQGGSPPSAQVDELQRRLDILAAEVEKLRSGEPETQELSDERRRALGLAPSAAATYRRVSAGISFAGYGEMLLENFSGRNQSGGGTAPTTRLDFVRAIVYTGYRFNDRVLFNSEVEVEHGGEISLEFAYLDYQLRNNLTLRGGMLLLPLGLVNELHEPTVYMGARRPETERRIIPSTWHENGGGLIGTYGPMNFRAYVVNGLSAAGFGPAGVRSGRQGGGEASAENVAFAGRLDVTPVPGVFAGVGLYRGGSGQGKIVRDGQTLDVATTIVEVHGQAQARGFDVRALLARASIADAVDLNAALGRPAGSPVAERMQGGYVQGGYNVLSRQQTRMSLLPYVRLEHVDTQHRVPAGFRRDLSQDGWFRTLGLEFKPIANIAVKTDYQWTTNEARTGRNQFNLSLGYAF